MILKVRKMNSIFVGFFVEKVLRKNILGSKWGQNCFVEMFWSKRLSNALQGVGRLGLFWLHVCSADFVFAVLAPCVQCWLRLCSADFVFAVLTSSLLMWSNSFDESFPSKLFVELSANRLSNALQGGVYESPFPGWLIRRTPCRTHLRRLRLRSHWPHRCPLHLHPLRHPPVSRRIPP